MIACVVASSASSAASRPRSGSRRVAGFQYGAFGMVRPRRIGRRCVPSSASSGERGCAHGYPLASRAFRDQPRFRKLLRNPVVFRLGQAVAYGIPEAGLKETLEHFMRGK